VPQACIDLILHSHHGIFLATASFFISRPIATNQNDRFNFNRSFETWDSSMTTTEKLQLAGLGLGLTVSVAWMAFLGFALSRAIVWLL
jgi:hypothetical protein